MPPATTSVSSWPSSSADSDPPAQLISPAQHHHLFTFTPIYYHSIIVDNHSIIVDNHSVIVYECGRWAFLRSTFRISPKRRQFRSPFPRDTTRGLFLTVGTEHQRTELTQLRSNCGRWATAAEGGQIYGAPSAVQNSRTPSINTLQNTDAEGVQQKRTPSAVLLTWMR